MEDLDADFIIENNEPLELEAEISEPEHFDCSFELYATGTTWGNISGTLSNQTDLQDALDLKADKTDVESVTGALADSIQAVDNKYDSITSGLDDSITAIDNKYDSITGALDDKIDSINGALSDDIDALESITGGLSDSIQAIDSTIGGYGDIVNYNAADFADSAQGALADTAVQPTDLASVAFSGEYSDLINTPTIPTVNDGELSIKVNGTEIATFTANQGTDTIADITIPNAAAWGNITGTLSDQTDLQNALDAKVTNNATGTNALAVGDTSQSTAEGGVAVGYGARANSTYATAIGEDTRANNTNTTVIGRAAKATEARAIAIGSGAEANAQDAIAIKGINNTANTFQVYTYNLLDMSTGLIPDARISSNIARTVDIPSLTNYVTTNTAQTISQTKAFSQPLVIADNNGLASGTILSNKKILQRSSGDNTLTLNNKDNKLRLVGSETRPQYSPDGTNFSELALYSDVTAINDLIPSAATVSNQLADKNFVNSSIATNTANFIGTFNSVAELEAYSGTLTNNDYAFVVGTDAEGNTVYDRYKYTDATTPPSWIFEYELNNSSFTAAQWDAINSGITSGDVALIATALQSGDNVSALVNDAGYITSSALTGYATETWVGNQGYALASSLATVATSGDYTDLLNTPTIPTVDQTYDGTSANAQSGVAIAGAGFLTGITSGDVTTALGYTPYNSTNPNGYITSAALTGYATENFVTSQGYITGIDSTDVTTALGYTPYNSSNPDGFITSADLPTNYVTTDTVQNITAEKTFVGNKLLKFKGVNASSKLGFTAYDSSNREVGYLECQGNGNASHKCRLGVYDTNTSNYDNVLGFEYYKAKGSDGVLHRYNLLAPPLYPSTTDTSFYIPMAITDGNTTVTASNTGSVDISSLLPTVPTNISAFNNDSGYITSSALSPYALTSSLATVATSGSYNDLTNTPTIPAAQVQADWNEADTTSKAYIQNKPTIPSGVVVDQTYDGTSQNAQSGVAIQGAGFVQNTSTGTNSLTILGTATNYTSSTNIGVNSVAGDTYTVALGYNAQASSNTSGSTVIGAGANSSSINGIAIGSGAIVWINNAIQLGAGTNSSGGFQVYNYQLLNKTTGLIPDERLSSNIARTVNVADISLSNLNSTGQAVIDGKVNKSGDTMTGTLKIFKQVSDDSNNFIRIALDDVTYGTNPPTQQNANIRFQDEFDNRMADLQYIYRTNGASDLTMVVKKYGEDTFAVIRTGFNSDGNAYCIFPNTECCDGQWIDSLQSLISSSVSLNSSSDLEYRVELPNDGKKYEVMVRGRVATGSTSGNFAYLSTRGNQDSYSRVIAGARTRTNSSMLANGTVTITASYVASGSKNITVTRNTNYNGTMEQLDVIAYRRIGTNS